MGRSDGPFLRTPAQPLPGPRSGVLWEDRLILLFLRPGRLIFNRSYIRSPTLLILSKHLENIIP